MRRDATAGLPLAIEVEADKYLSQRIELLHAEFQRVDRLAQTNELPEASVIKGVLKITPLDRLATTTGERMLRFETASCAHSGSNKPGLIP